MVVRCIKISQSISLLSILLYEMNHYLVFFICLKVTVRSYWIVDLWLNMTVMHSVSRVMVNYLVQEVTDLLVDQLVSLLMRHKTADHRGVYTIHHSHITDTQSVGQVSPAQERPNQIVSKTWPCICFKYVCTHLAVFSSKFVCMVLFFDKFLNWWSFLQYFKKSTAWK